MHTLALPRHGFRFLTLIGAACPLLLGACYFDPTGAPNQADGRPNDQHLLLVDRGRPADGPTPPRDVPTTPGDRGQPDREPVPDKGPPPPPPPDQTIAVDSPRLPDMPRPHDLRPAPDQKPPPPTTCKAVFDNAGIPGYFLCLETAQGCYVFFNASQNTSCETICNKGGRGCWGMYNTDPPQGCANQNMQKEPCTSGKLNALCVCYR